MIPKNNSEKSKLVFIFLIICLVTSGSFIIFNSIGVYYASAGSGAPPINGTTTATWYVDGQVVRKFEWINTSDIQINDTGSMEWVNIIAEVSGNITVNNNGYFNLTNCIVILNGNLTINGAVNFRNVSLELNSTYDGEFSIEVFGSLYIYDLDQDDTTTEDASVIDAGNGAYEYLVWIRNGAVFEMRCSELHNCGWNYTYPGLVIKTNNTIIENNIISFNYIGIHYNHSSNNILMNNTLESNIYAGVRIANGSDNKLGFNTINNNIKGIRLENTTKNSIFDNTITICTKDGVELLEATYNIIEHNTISNCQDDGVDVDMNSDFNRVSNNTISSSVIGTFLTGADYNVIYNNTYSNNDNSSIVTYLQSNNNRIIKNRCTGTQVGIVSLAANRNSYHFNRIYSNDLGGLGFSSSSGNILTHNDITSNTYYGIFLNSSSTNNEIHYNNITGHFFNGIYVEDAGSKVNATYNWWGSWSGPKHTTTNPSGTGDEVTNYVIYRPWGLFNVPPKIEVIDKKNAKEDTYYQQVYSASDLNGDTIYWHQVDNATWLNWSSANLKLYGIPDNSKVGSYWVRINISDGAGGFDETNFTLNVSNVAPEILNSNIATATEDMYYYNDYNSTDDGSGSITWVLNSNTSWLDLDSDTGDLSGTPGNAEVGEYWVEVIVSDGNGGVDAENFTLTVINTNDPPEIVTKNVVTTAEDELYIVEYQAEDIDPTEDELTWSLKTNAGWLTLNKKNGRLAGTPDNEEVGEYWVNVSVSDGLDGLDWARFNLRVNNVNDKPIIITIDDELGRVDEEYSVDYAGEDVDPTNDILTWSLNTNASWLTINSVTGLLYGIPSAGEDGYYWVNVTVSDGNGGISWHNFTLTVIPGEQEPPNQNPIITTKNVLSAEVGKKYYVVYSATDDRTPVTSLSWAMKTNATWLEFEKNGGVLFGTPQEHEVGKYWVYISVTDSEDGWAVTNFTLEVTKPWIENYRPNLTAGNLSPEEGNTETSFTFTVKYSDADNDPGEVWVWIDNEKFNMTPELDNYNFIEGVLYTYNTTLGKGIHSYYFTATDGVDNAEPGDSLTPTSSETALATPNIQDVEKAGDGDGDGGSEESLMGYVAFIIVIIIIIILLAFVYINRGKKGGKEKQNDEPDRTVKKDRLKKDANDDNVVTIDRLKRRP